MISTSSNDSSGAGPSGSSPSSSNSSRSSSPKRRRRKKKKVRKKKKISKAKAEYNKLLQYKAQVKLKDGGSWDKHASVQGSDEAREGENEFDVARRRLNKRKRTQDLLRSLRQEALARGMCGKADQPILS